MTSGDRIVVEYNGRLVALRHDDAARFVADGTIAFCTTCEPPCGYHHISPDRLPDAVLDAGSPIGPHQAAELRAQRALITIQSSHTEHP